MATPTVYATTKTNPDAPEVTGIPYVDSIIAGAGKRPGAGDGIVNRPQDLGAGSEPVAQAPQAVAPSTGIPPMWVWAVIGIAAAWWLMKKGE